MNDGSPAFERAADELERLSRLSRIEARGTLRIALKEAGLLPRAVNHRSMLVVFEKVLPQMLARRGVREAAEICKAIAAVIRERAGMEGSSDGDTPEKVFARMGRPSVPPPSPTTTSSFFPPPISSETPSPPSSESSVTYSQTRPITGQIPAVPKASPDRSGRR